MRILLVVVLVVLVGIAVVGCMPVVSHQNYGVQDMVLLPKGSDISEAFEKYGMPSDIYTGEKYTVYGFRKETGESVLGFVFNMTTRKDIICVVDNKTGKIIRANNVDMGSGQNVLGWNTHPVPYSALRNINDMTDPAVGTNHHENGTDDPFPSLWR